MKTSFEANAPCGQLGPSLRDCGNALAAGPAVNTGALPPTSPSGREATPPYVAVLAAHAGSLTADAGAPPPTWSPEREATPPRERVLGSGFSGTAPPAGVSAMEVLCVRWTLRALFSGPLPAPHER